VLESGRIVLQGAGKDLVNDEHVRAAYLGARASRRMKVEAQS
jgi:ABC-type branched-subunit amino acid transport system ATPase component